MNSSFFDIFKNENLNKPMLVLKGIGQFGALIALVGVAISQFNGGQVGGSPFLDAIAGMTTYGLLVGIACFVVIALYAAGKKGGNSTAQAVGRSFLKVFLYMYVPAIILTLLLAVIFIIPGYQ